MADDRSAKPEGKKFYHVTHKDNVKYVLSKGLKGGHGDAGHGVYLWDSMESALDYGTGQEPFDPKKHRILEVTSDDPRSVDIPNEWEDEREKYEHTHFVPVQEGKFWKPKKVKKT